MRQLLANYSAYYYKRLAPLCRRVYRGIMPPMPAPPSKILYLRGVPTNLTQKLKASAALRGTSLQEYVVEVLQAHVTELERKGQLPKSK